MIRKKGKNNKKDLTHINKTGSNAHNTEFIFKSQFPLSEATLPPGITHVSQLKKKQTMLLISNGHTPLRHLHFGNKTYPSKVQKHEMNRPSMASPGCISKA